VYGKSEALPKTEGLMPLLISPDAVAKLASEGYWRDGRPLGSLAKTSRVFASVGRSGRL